MYTFHNAIAESSNIQKVGVVTAVFKGHIHLKKFSIMQK